MACIMLSIFFFLSFSTALFCHATNFCASYVFHSAETYPQHNTHQNGTHMSQKKRERKKRKGGTLRRLVVRAFRACLSTL